MNFFSFLLIMYNINIFPLKYFKFNKFISYIFFNILILKAKSFEVNIGKSFL